MTFQKSSAATTSTSATSSSAATSARPRSLAARARAEATRRRVIEAAGPLLAESGYLETTMAGIARAAGVAVQTLYLSFGSKSAVLEAALTAAAPDHPNEWSGGDEDGPSALARHIAATVTVIERQYPLAAVLRAAAADPEPADLLERTRRDALAGHARAVDELAERPGFTDRISLQRATEIMTAMLSPESYGLLVVAQGWPTPDWVDWVTRHLAADLFPGRADPAVR